MRSQTTTTRGRDSSRETSIDPSKLSSLANLAMVFEGGAGATGTFEVAGVDYGDSTAGLNSNFARGTLKIGGEAGIGKLTLVNSFDNQPAWAGKEVLYVRNLVLGSGSSLDLGGFTLYYGTLSNSGGTIDLNGGSLGPGPVPEHATSSLLALASLMLLRRRKWQHLRALRSGGSEV